MTYYQNPHKVTGNPIDSYLEVPGLVITENEKEKCLLLQELWIVEGEFCFSAAASLETALLFQDQFDAEARFQLSVGGYVEVLKIDPVFGARRPS